MKIKVSCFFGLWAAFLSSASACSTCFGNYAELGGPPPGNVRHLAMAIWALLFLVMGVLGGVGMFSLHLWRMSRAPIQPHEELAEEDFSKYA